MYKWFNRHVADVLIVIIVSIFFSLLQLSVWGKFIDHDGFYHIKVAQLMSSGGMQGDFPWLQYTTWNQSFADQHYLYHGLLIIFNNIEWLQLSVILFATLFVAFLLWLMHELLLGWKMFWLAIILLGSVDFLFRINLVKANTLSLALLCIIGILLTRFHESVNKIQSLIGIGVISGLFVWVYGGFVCVPFFIGAYCGAVLIMEKRFQFLPLLVSCLGIALGLLFHPHSSNLLALLYDQLFYAGIGSGQLIPVGDEWLSYDIVWFFKSNVLVIFIWLLSLQSYFALGGKLNWKSLWLHLVSFGFLILTLWHRRFVEYWVPFTVLAAAVSLAPYLTRISWDKYKAAFTSYLVIKVMSLFLSMLLILFISWNVYTVWQILNTGEDSHKYEASTQWLQQNSQAGDLVLNTRWDQWPQLFYWNHFNYYMVGLDPTFMYLYNESIYWDWRKVADDNPKKWESIEALHSVTKEKLKAKFIIVDIEQNENIYNYIIESDPDKNLFNVVYEKENIVILEVK